jgi:hypothetical protein
MPTLSNLNRRPNGYYTVGEEIYFNKVPALVKASHLNVFPKWHFYQEVYSNLDWAQDSNKTLVEWYRLRALQLRERYDHLILNFSGGSDSWTILKAFVDNGIHLDEIVVRWPFYATSRKHIPSTDVSSTNLLSEWDFTINPMLKQIESQNPEIKITIDDWSIDLDKIELTDDQWHYYTDYLNPACLLKANQKTPTEERLISKGKTCAQIVGVDKPQMFFSNGKIYCYFLDKLGNSRRMLDQDRNLELFYWTADMPELVHAQAREIFNVLKFQPFLINLIDKNIPYNRERKNLWDKFVTSVIYKDYASRNFFQTKKSSSCLIYDGDAWLHQEKNLRLLDSWESGIKNLYASIDKKYFEYRNNEIVGLIGFVDGVFCLGELEKPTEAGF